MARFADPHTLDLSTGEKLTAKHFVIATGSVVAPLPAPARRSWLSDQRRGARLKRLPKSLIVLGGGAVAVEFAQFFARFGVQVTLIQRSPHVLREFDSDAAGELEKVFRREGIVLYTGTKLLDARRVGDEKEVAFEHDGQTVRARAEEILFALGRIPNIASLGLDRHRGATRSPPHCDQCAHADHRAAHLCRGRLHRPARNRPHRHSAGRVAAHNIAHPDRMKQMDYRLLTEVIFTEPQIAVVGLTEKSARARGIPYLAASYPFNDHGKSLIMEAKDGFVKLLADPLTGEIIGGCCVGPGGGELIHEIVAAMHKRMTVHELAAMPHYHPTLAEIWTYPAEELASPSAAQESREPVKP